MIKIVSFGSSNPIQAISEGVEKIGEQSGVSLHRINFEDDLTEVYNSRLTLDDLYWIKNADVYLGDGTWGSTNPARQWKPDKIYMEETKLAHGRPSTAIRSARMEFINVWVQELAKLYNKKVIVTESPTLSRIKCNYKDIWYKNSGPRYYRMGLGHWTYGRTKWCQGDKSVRLESMIHLIEAENKDIKLKNIYNHKWKYNKDGAVLIVPGLEYDPTSSVPVEEFIKKSVEKVRESTTRKILVKAHPLSKLVIQDLVKGVEVIPQDQNFQFIRDRVYCAVLGESTSIFQLINLGIPCITSKWNFGYRLRNQSIDKIEELYYATPEEVLEWYKMLSYTEFKLSEFSQPTILNFIRELLYDTK